MSIVLHSHRRPPAMISGQGEGGGNRFVNQKIEKITLPSLPSSYPFLPSSYPFSPSPSPKLQEGGKRVQDGHFFPLDVGGRGQGNIVF